MTTERISDVQRTDVGAMHGLNAIRVQESCEVLCSEEPRVCVRTEAAGWMDGWIPGMRHSLLVCVYDGVDRWERITRQVSQKMAPGKDDYE